MHELKYEAATWGFSWKEADGNSTIGIASFNDSDGVQIDVPYGSLLDGGHHLIDEQHEAAELLFGISRKNDYIVVSDCDGHNTEYRFPGIEKQTVRGNWIMGAKSEFDPSAPITEIRFKLKGLLEWSGRIIVEEETRFDNNHNFLQSSALLSSDALEKEELYSNEEYSVALYYSSIRGSKKLSETVFRNSAAFNIKFNNAASLADALLMLHKTQSFVSFCCGWYANIETVTLVNDQGISIDFCCRFVSDNRVLSQDDFAHMPMPLKRIKSNISVIMENWFYASEGLVAAISVLVPLSTRQTSTYVDLQFLAASQVIESLAVEGVDVRAFSEERFSEIETTIRNSIEDKEIRDWACNRLFGSNSNRLGQRKLLSNLYDYIGDFAVRIFPNKKDFIKRQAQMRNDVTHRNPSAMSIDHSMMFYHTQGIIILCHAAVMRKLGITEDEITALFSESYFRWYLIEKAASI